MDRLVALQLIDSREVTSGGRHVDAMLKRFSEQAPVAVMARLGMQRAIGADWVNPPRTSPLGSSTRWSLDEAEGVAKLDET